MGGKGSKDRGGGKPFLYTSSGKNHLSRPEMLSEKLLNASIESLTAFSAKKNCNVCIKAFGCLPKC